MSLQNIVNSAASITFARKRLTGQSISRAGILKTASVLNNTPWQITVEPNPGMRYSENRATLEMIDLTGRDTEATIDIGSSNPSLSYITAYRGDATDGLALLGYLGYSGSTMYINCANVTPSSGAGLYLFRKGDFVQPTGHRYPYTVTADVPITNASNVSIPLHRPFIYQENGMGAVGTPIKIANQVTWKVKMLTQPSYTVLPYDRVQFDSAFELIEVIEEPNVE